MPDILSKAATKAALIPRLNIELNTVYAVVVISMLLCLFNGLAILLVIPLLAGCRLITANDDQAFRMLWLFINRRVLNPDLNGWFWKSSSYTNHKTRF